MRYGNFCDFLEAKIVNLGLIDSQLDLSLNNINGNDPGQNKFEVHTSKIMAKMANFRPKIGKDASFAPTFNDHYSAIFFDFWSSTSHGQHWVYVPKTTLKLLVHVLAMAPNLKLKGSQLSLVNWTVKGGALYLNEGRGRGV